MGIDRFVRLGMAIPEEYIREIFDIPAPAAGAKLLEAKSSGEAAALRAALTAAPASPLDEVGQLAQATAPEMDSLVATVGRMVDDAPDLESLQTALLQAFGDLDSDRLVTLMEAAFMLATLKGMDDVQREADRA